MGRGSKTSRNWGRDGGDGDDAVLKEEVEAFLDEENIDQKGREALLDALPAVQREVMDDGPFTDTSNPSRELMGRLKAAQSQGRSLQRRVKEFVDANDFDDRARQEFLEATPEQQEAVLSRGPLTETRSPSAVLMSRLRQVKRKEPEYSPEEVFLRDNKVDQGACRKFWDASPDVQQAVMQQGSLLDTTNPSAALLGRIRHASKSTGGSGYEESYASYPSSSSGRDHGRDSWHEFQGWGSEAQPTVTKVEIHNFLVKNNIDFEAAEKFKDADVAIQRIVLDKGDLWEAKNPSAFLLGQLKSAASKLARGKKRGSDERGGHADYNNYGSTGDDSAEEELCPLSCQDRPEPICSGLRVLRAVGEGNFGKVSLAVLPSGHKVAVKVVASESDDVTWETWVGQSIPPHRNLVVVLQEFLHEEPGKRLLAMEYCPGGTLWDMYPVQEDTLLQAVRDVASGLAHLHSHHVIHCDVKAENVLASNQDFKLCDLGLAHWGDRGFEVFGTMVFAAPEASGWDGSFVCWTFSRDIWSLGCMILEMSGVDIEVGTAAVQLAQMVIGSQALWDILRMCCQRIPALRASAAEVAEATDARAPNQWVPQKEGSGGADSSAEEEEEEEEEEERRQKQEKEEMEENKEREKWQEQQQQQPPEAEPEGEERTQPQQLEVTQPQGSPTDPTKSGDFSRSPQAGKGGPDSSSSSSSSDYTVSTRAQGEEEEEEIEEGEVEEIFPEDGWFSQLAASRQAQLRWRKGNKIPRGYGRCCLRC